jgi:TolB protein
MPRRWWWDEAGRAGRAGLAEFRLWDVFSGRQLASQRFVVGQGEWRRLGHLVADQVYQRLTGEKGYFDTQIVFVDETGPQDRRNKRLAIMDQDGANVRLLSQGRELVLTPRFSPTAQEITFMQYTGDQPRVFLMNLETGKRELVGDFPGMTFAPRFSPDGQRVVKASARAGPRPSSDGPASRQTRHLTPASSIPATVPTAAASCSDRITTGPSSSTSWAPTAPASAAQRRPGPLLDTGAVAARRLIAVQQMGGSFLIGVMRSDGSRRLRGFWRGPTWAPTAACSCSSASRGGTGG